MTFFDNIGSWFTHDAWPTLHTFLNGLVHDEVAAVAPIAQAAVARVVAAEANAIATGDSKDTGHILAAAVRETTNDLRNAGIKAGSNSILTAVGAAMPAPAK